MAGPLGLWELAKLLDPIGVITIVSDLSRVWTPIEKNTLLIGLEGSLLSNRLLWVGIAPGMLAFANRSAAPLVEIGARIEP